MATDNNHLGWPEEGSLAGVHAPHQLLAGLPVTAHIPEWKRGSRAHAHYLKPAHVHNRPATSPYIWTSTYMYDGVHCLSSSHLSRGCDWSVPLLARRDLQLQPRLQADLALMEASWWWAEIVCTRSMKQATLITPRPCRGGRNRQGHYSAFLHSSAVGLLLTGSRRLLRFTRGIISECQTGGKSPVLWLMIRLGNIPEYVELFLSLMC